MKARACSAVGAAAPPRAGVEGPRFTCAPATPAARTRRAAPPALPIQLRPMLASTRDVTPSSLDHVQRYPRPPRRRAGAPRVRDAPRDRDAPVPPGAALDLLAEELRRGGAGHQADQPPQCRLPPGGLLLG